MSLFKINPFDTKITQQQLQFKLMLLTLCFFSVCITPLSIGIYLYPKMLVLSTVLTAICAVCCSYFMTTIFINSFKDAKEINDNNHHLENFLNDLNHAILALSNGHTHQSLKGGYEGKFGETAIAFNESLKEISQTIYAVKNISGVLFEAGHLISDRSKDLAMRAEQQATSLQETTSTMEEMTENIKQNADNSQKANELSDISVIKATNGHKIVVLAIDSMSKLEKNTKRVRDIVKLIEDIAAQTNMLALNAAVEAARAGDSGRGFSVVASEVRILAQRTKDAACEIGDITTTSSNDVDECVVYVTQTAEALSEIVAAINSVEAVITDITTSSRQQATSASEISNTLFHIDDTIQKTTLIADECANTSAQIKNHIDDLAKAIHFFKLPTEQLHSLRDTLHTLKHERNTFPNRPTNAFNTEQQGEQNLPEQINKRWSEF
jgi:methyl-accepting chemotaxis protein